MVNRNGLIQMLLLQPKEILVGLIHTNFQELLLTLLRQVMRVAQVYWTD
jgi:hypothetical protein